MSRIELWGEESKEFQHEARVHIENFPGVLRELQVPFLLGGNLGREMSGRRWGSFGSQIPRALNITLP